MEVLETHRPKYCCLEFKAKVTRASYDRNNAECLISCKTGKSSIQQADHLN